MDPVTASGPFHPPLLSGTEVPPVFVHPVLLLGPGPGLVHGPPLAGQRHDDSSGSGGRAVGGGRWSIPPSRWISFSRHLDPFGLRVLILRANLTLQDPGVTGESTRE